MHDIADSLKGATKMQIDAINELYEAINGKNQTQNRLYNNNPVFLLYGIGNLDDCGFMDNRLEDLIRKRAYEIYERRQEYNVEGSPESDWEQAEFEVIEDLSFYLDEYE